MKVKVNDKSIDTKARTVKELALEQRIPDKGVAIAIDNELVPHSEWITRTITEDDDIIILKAFSGG